MWRKFTLIIYRSQTSIAVVMEDLLLNVHCSFSIFSRRLSMGYRAKARNTSFPMQHRPCHDAEAEVIHRKKGEVQTVGDSQIGVDRQM